MVYGGMRIFLMKLKNILQSDNGFWVKLFTLLLCGAIVFTAFFSVRSWENEYLQDQLEKSASAYQSLFSARIHGYVAELLALKRFYDGSDFVDREGFKKFIAPVLNNSPDIHTFK